MKKRLDVYCVEIGMFESREKAKAHIMAGDVIVNGQKIYDSSYKVKENDKVELCRDSCPYVSRAGLKLKHAIDFFKISLKDKVCLDVGVATGGFSDCMIKEGAKKVYGVDVGRGQVHEKLLGDNRFIFIPQTNARYLRKDVFEDEIEFAAVDVSFISLKLILKPLIESVGRRCDIILLVKPQFELKPEFLKKGIVKTEEHRKKALEEIKNFIKENFKNVKITGETDSPVKGTKGNREFLLYLIKEE